MNATSPAPRAVVTGAGSGLGLELVRGLADRGYEVLGTCLSGAEAETASQRLQDWSAQFLVCDVTDDEAVDRLRLRVEHWQPGGLDLLVSNAATITPGPLEALALDAVRREFAVNVVGALAVVRVLLPSLRRAAVRGRVVHIGSRAGHLPMPFNGVCGATKAAMDVLADVLRTELLTSGVDVVVAVPGSIRTDGLTGMTVQVDRLQQSMTAEHKALYGPALGAFAQHLAAAPDVATDPAQVAADVIEQAARAWPAPARVTVDAEAERVIRLSKTLTDADLDRLRREAVDLTAPDVTAPDLAALPPTG